MTSMTQEEINDWGSAILFASLDWGRKDRRDKWFLRVWRKSMDGAEYWLHISSEKKA